MKVPKPEVHVPVTNHHWITAFFMILGLGIVAVAGFWIRKCKCSTVGRHEYSALKRADSGGETNYPETEMYDGAFMACRQFLSGHPRFELRAQLERIGSRANKHWFIVQDVTLDAERLLSFVSLPTQCPITPSTVTSETVLALFRGLQHPYIYPVLDIQFLDTQVALICPLSHGGSLRDLIYASAWHEDCDRKYSGRGEGLPLWQIQRLGRQILEAMLFLRDRGFPPVHHLHSGNVILQNGVARVAGLENSLLGMASRLPTAPDVLGFGHLLFEMTTGYELPTPPSPAHLELELERFPKVVEVLRLIFQNLTQLPTLEELICCDLFRGVELRELRGINVMQSRYAPEILEVFDLARKSITASGGRCVTRRFSECRRLEDIIEEDMTEENGCDVFLEVER
ncbi:hypothetical protein PPYR_12713 [Photinus pyralis]|uniref:Protein kinase domain-containing protein n=1 Tax=Photinus pyralis TaxID=7054 RepID=A0A5N4A700_PHOPY|nr:slowpoke-binding protein isoform X2 [Photinus pyralis]KAB0793093.1 hypothetical protein PPYR_12713 [Photinus pyralis]